MSDNENQMHPLHVAYLAALDSQGRAAADLVITANGGRPAPHGWRHVPAPKIAAAIAGLNALATGHKSDTAAIASGLDEIRASAFAKMGGKAKSEPAQLPASWDELQREAMARFNATPTRD